MTVFCDPLISILSHSLQIQGLDEHLHPIAQCLLADRGDLIYLDIIRCSSKRNILELDFNRLGYILIDSHSDESDRSDIFSDLQETVEVFFAVKSLTFHHDMSVLGIDGRLLYSVSNDPHLPRVSVVWCDVPNDIEEVTSD